MDLEALEQTGQEQEVQQQPITEDRVKVATEILSKYKQGKQNLESRIIENEKWYKLRHWETFNKANGEVEPKSAWLFNSLFNKHADAMDNFPEPNILPREANDQQEAETLSSIIPLVLEHNEFEETYSDVWWYKLKNGVAAYGVFWNQELEQGLGDIDIKKLDLLNIFWEPGVTDIQKSRNIFIVNLVDKDILEQQYPDMAGKAASKIIEVADYVYDDTVDTEDKTLVVDWYYKSRVNNKEVVHFVKFAGDTLLYATENDPDYRDSGLYDHGKYPIVFDVLFPLEGTPTGFGFVDIMRDTQMYIDKLDKIILTNAAMCGKKRFFTKDNGSVNEDEFADWSNPFVHVAGALDEDSIREINVSPVDSFIMQHQIHKIDELKETSGNRDFSQGSTSGGVTAASAIAALQEAGNKLSRDIIRGSYRVFSQINYICIELIRQFYDETRQFRIKGADGSSEFLSYNNQNLKGEPIPTAYPGQELEPDYQAAFRQPVFDIKVKPQKANPFSRMAQNELAKELYGAGFFNPQMADQALIALELMTFEGKEKVVEYVTQNAQLVQQMQLMQERMAKMGAIIQQNFGVDLLGMMQQEGTLQGAGAAPIPSGQATSGENMGYGEKIVNGARADVTAR